MEMILLSFLFKSEKGENTYLINVILVSAIIHFILLG